VTLGDLTVSRQAGVGHGWRGYFNFLKLFGLAILAGLGTAWVLVAVPGLRVEEAAGSATVAVALIVTFGLGYAFDASPHRVDLYGHLRERAAAGLVFGFFMVAVTTLFSLVAYQLWPLGQLISFGACGLGPGICRVLPQSVDPGPWLAGYGVVGLAMTLAGAAQLFLVMYRPPRLDPAQGGYDVWWRRLVARALDALVLLLGVLVVLRVFGSVRSGTAAGWAVSIGLLLWAFLYEVLALMWGRGRTLGKLVFGVRVVSARKRGAVQAVSVVPALVRAGVTSVVYSFGTYVVLVFSLGRDIERTFVIQMIAMGVVYVSPVLHVGWQGLHDALLCDTRVIRYRRESRDKRSVVGSESDVNGLRLRASASSTDVLDRSNQVKIVSGVIRRATGPAVLMVNAPWGGGKSTFLTMCAEELNARGKLVVEFNSWTQQYTKKPLVDLVGAISQQIRARRGDDTTGDLKDYATPLAEVFGRSRNIRRLFVSWDSTSEAVCEFSTALSDLVKRHGTVVLLVDELDRCQADYALGTLETLHHLFAVEGVVSLVGISRDDLCHTVRSLYGERFDADTYLRRFADLLIDLPPPTHANLTKFLERQLEATGLQSRIRGTTAQILTVITELETCSLRDLEQATHLAALALAADPPTEHPMGVWDQSVMAMIVLRAADRDAYRRFARRQTDSFTALAAANAKLPPYPDIAGPPRILLHRTLFEAALLNVEPAEFEDTASFQYQAAHELEGRKHDIEHRLGGTTEDAEAVLRSVAALRSQYPTPPGWTPLRVELIADRLDLLAE